MNMRFRHLGLLLLLTGLFWYAPGTALATGADVVDTLYYNGVIRPMTESPREAADMRAAHVMEVVAVRDGKILFAGTEKEARDRGYFQTARRLLDLKGKTLLPGFVDGHGHFPEQGQYDLYEVNLNSFPLGTMTSIADYQRVLGERCATAGPDEWVMGWGYDDTSIMDLRHPARQDIDAVCPRNPVYLRHISGHMGVGNSRALELAGITPGDPAKFGTEGVVKDAEGQATGLLMETKAMGLVTSLPVFPVPDARKSLARASHVYAAAGVSTVDQGASMIAMHLPLFQSGLALNILPLRVVLHPLAIYELVTPEGTADAAGWMNRAALGWREADGPGGAGQDAALFSDAAKAVQTGGDLTRYPAKTCSGDPRHGEPLCSGEIPVPDGLPADMLFLGAWKLLFDGSPQGYTAWLKSPGYYNWGTYTAADSFDGASYFNGARGTLNILPARLEELLKLYHRAGQSTETHVNGNAAAEAWITGMEKAVVAFPDREDTRHTAIHAQMLELQHIQRMTGNYEDLPGTAHLYAGLDGAFRGGRLDPGAVGASSIEVLAELMKKQHLFSSYFIDHVYFWGDRHRNIFMGPGRADNMSPVGWSVHYDQPYGFHSDTFVTPIHPLRSVQTAVTRLSAPTPLSAGGTLIDGTGRDIQATVEFPARDPAQVPEPDMGIFPNYDQRINVLQALLGVTRLPAWQNKLDRLVGSLQEGKAADFVILEQDPLLVAQKFPEKLADIRVMATLVGDRLVYGFLPGTAFLAGPPVPAYVGNETTSLRMLDRAPLDGQKADSVLRAGERLLGAYTVRAAVRGMEHPVFQMDMLGNGGSVRNLRLYGLMTASGWTELTYAEQGGLRGGTFRVASLRDPVRGLGPDDILEEDATYIVFCSPEVVAPEKAEREITVNLLLATTGRLPGNGGTTPEMLYKDR